MAGKKSNVRHTGITARLMQYLEGRDGTNVYLNEVADYLQVHPSIAQSAMNNLRNRDVEKNGFHWRKAVHVITRGRVWSVQMDRGRPVQDTARAPEPKLGTMTLEVIARLDTGDLLLREPGGSKLYQLKPIGY